MMDELINQAALNVRSNINDRRLEPFNRLTISAIQMVLVSLDYKHDGVVDSYGHGRTSRVAQNNTISVKQKNNTHNQLNKQRESDESRLANGGGNRNQHEESVKLQ